MAPPTPARSRRSSPRTPETERVLSSRCAHIAAPSCSSLRAGGFWMNLVSRNGWRQYIRGFTGDRTAPDTHNVRGLLRHHLTETTKAIVVAALLAAAAFGLGNAPLHIV